MTKLPKVRDCMDTVVPTLTPQTGMLEAVDFLLHHHVTGAPVLDAAGAMVGIVTEKDCLRLLTTGVEEGQAPPVVGDFMSAKVESVPPDMDVYYLAGMFLRTNFRRFPVVENGRLVGAVTRFDLLRVIQANLKKG